MKKMMMGAIAALMAMASCQNETMTTADERKPVTFSTAQVQTRVSGASWSTNDSIGVYMYQGSWSGTVTPNVAYATPQGNGTFTAAPTPLYFPADGSSVGFAAYYPYTAKLSGQTYTFDLTQKEATADFLYSNNITNWTAAAQSGSLSFSRPLSALQLVITTDSSLVAADSLRVTVSGWPTQATLDMQSGALSVTSTSIGTYSVLAAGSGKSFTATVPVFPGVSAGEATLTLSTVKQSQTFTLPAGTTFEAGKRNELAVSVQGFSTSVTTPTPPATNYTAFRETPVITQQQLNDNRYIIHYRSGNASARNYSMLYSPTYKIAFWVAYPLTSSYVGSVDRTNDWGYDPKVPTSEQANLSSGFGTGSGYDRGHQLPSADRTATVEENQSTFYYTNMTPQNSRLNQGLWASLEGKVRGWMSGTDTLFVVTGAMPYTATDTNTSYVKGMAIPKYYFKALARKISGKFQTIAFKFNNEQPASNDHTQYAISVAELERVTGFTFFPTLAADEKAAYTISYWQ